MAKEASKANVPATPAGAAETPKKMSRKKKILIIVVALLLILGAGGGGAYWWFFLRVPPGGAAASSGAAQQGKESASRASEQPRVAGVMLPLPRFVVNLSDPGKRLRLSMELEANADISKELQVNDARIRDAMITLLAGRAFADLQSQEDRNKLRIEIEVALGRLLGASRIMRIYFTEFVVE